MHCENLLKSHSRSQFGHLSKMKIGFVFRSQTMVWVFQQTIDNRFLILFLPQNLLAKEPG